MMGRLIPKIRLLTFSTFPLLAEWSRMPSFVGWVAVSFGIAAQTHVPWNKVFSSILYNEALIVAIVLSLVVALAVSYLPVRFAFFAISGFLAALCATENQHEVYRHATDALGDHAVVFLSARVESVPALSFGEYCFTVCSDSIFADNHKGAFFNKTLTCYSFQKPPQNGSFTARGRFRAPRPAENPGAYDDFLNSLANNVWGRFYVDTILDAPQPRKSFWNTVAGYARTTVVEACSQIRNSDDRAIIVASFLNDRSDLSNTVRDLFFKAGIYHLLALSGFNVAILAAALFAFLTFLPVGKTVKIAVVLICIWSYYFFIGSIPSLFRAVLMTTIVLAAYLFQRKPHGLNSLGLAGMLWLFFSPSSLFTPSYQLSFSATLGLVTIYPPLSRRFLPSQKSIFGKWVAVPLGSMFFVSLAAFLATAPVLAFHFGTLSLSGIVANLFAVSLMSIAMWIALAGFFLQVCMPVFVPLCMHAAEFTVDVMIRCSALVTMVPLSMARLPQLQALAYAPYVVFFTGLCTLKPGVSVKRYLLWALPTAVLAFAILAAVQMSSLAPTVTSFSLKKASLTGIRWPDGKLWLVGTWPEGAAFSTFSRVIVPWMRCNFSRHVDAVVVPGDPCNAVQAIEPLLKDAGLKKICSLTQAHRSCADFPMFLDEFGARLVTLNEGKDFSPDADCSCMFLPKASLANGETVRSVTISMFGRTMTIPDSSGFASGSNGAVTLTFSRTRPPVRTEAIPDWHPLHYH
jgi:ComEC/Rec2-related protein